MFSHLFFSEAGQKRSRTGTVTRDIKPLVPDDDQSDASASDAEELNRSNVLVEPDDSDGSEIDTEELNRPTFTKRQVKRVSLDESSES